MAQATQALARDRRYGKTQRLDQWWLEPALVAAGLLLFVIYSTVSAVLGDHWQYQIGPYLSPFYEPLIHPDWLPKWFSPALIILGGPLSFRLTCYYYRRAYYRSYFMSPPACAVREPAKRYSGESRFPFILQNLHRFALYIAIIFAVLLWIGALKSFRYHGDFGLGLGSLILVVNAFLISMYTFGCHSFRHLVGGSLNCFSCSSFRRTRRKAWDLVTVANEHHRLWAWLSLITVGLTDLYIHLVANGMISDPNTWSRPLA